MRDWIHSRRVQSGMLAAIGLFTAGTCGGALLANYTVAGMNPQYTARADMPEARPQRGTAEWMADAAFRDVASDRGSAAFADPWNPQPAEDSLN